MPLKALSLHPIQIFWSQSKYTDMVNTEVTVGISDSHYWSASINLLRNHRRKTFWISPILSWPWLNFKKKLLVVILHRFPWLSVLSHIRRIITHKLKWIIIWCSRSKKAVIPQSNLAVWLSSRTVISLLFNGFPKHFVQIFMAPRWYILLVCDLSSNFTISSVILWNSTMKKNVFWWPLWEKWYDNHCLLW